MRHSLAIGANANGAAAPVAVNDAYTTPANTPFNVPAPGVPGNDTGGGALTALRISTPNHGMVELNADGRFVYMPLPNYSGPGSFTYKVRCGLIESAAALVHVTVAAPNNRPPTIVSAAWVRATSAM